MVIGAPRTRSCSLLQYHLLTHWLYIPRFLGLNMIEPHKPLIDSRLAVFRISDSNKTAPKPMKNAPIFTGAGQNKNTNVTVITT